MKKIISLFLIFFLSYCISWGVTYSIIMKMDYRYFLEYLRMSWSGPGEIPAFIQISALFISVIMTVIAGFVMQKK